MATDHNKKLPKDAWSADVIKPQYGWVYGSADGLGGHTFHYRNLEEPKKASSQTLLPSGGYETVEYDEDRKEIKTNLNPGESRSYTGGGASMHAGGSVDQSSDSTMRTTVVGDIGEQGGKNKFSGIAENNLSGSKNAFNYTVGSSESKTYTTSRGDTVAQHNGNEHKSIEGDVVTSVKGSKVLIIQSGDQAIRIQGGNLDTEVASKMRYKASDTILIESDQAITLKVGATTFTIGAGGIGMTTNSPINLATSSTINLTASEDINIAGATTKIQGGGMIAPPTTFG